MQHARGQEPQIWYAAYGSNLDLARFRLYLEGGIPYVGARPHRRCLSGVEILESRPFTTNHHLYFAGKSDKWAGGGVAFIDLVPRDGAQTLCRAYRLRLSQFEHVVSEENGGRRVTVTPDSLVIPSSPIRDRGWYRILVRLGAIEGAPVLTITGVPDEIGERNPPSQGYLDRIRTGLMQTYPDMTLTAVGDYLAGAV